MKTRPMLFSGPMVRAILAGTKTQTRRVVKPQPVPATTDVGTFHHPDDDDGRGPRFWSWGPDPDHPGRGYIQPDWAIPCPYGQPGDQLWVRETFYAFGRWVTQFNAKKGRDEWHFIDMTLESGKSYLHPASDSQPQPMGGKRHKGGITPTWWKRPAIFMPAAASRITLEVTGVRVERLQDISETDALAEGIVQLRDGGFGLPAGEHYHATDPRISYWSLWDHINGPGSVEANPWVWVVEWPALETSK